MWKRPITLIGVSKIAREITGRRAEERRAHEDREHLSILLTHSNAKPSVRIWTTPQHDGKVRLSVRDNGIGIGPSDQERIWGI